MERDEFSLTIRQTVFGVTAIVILSKIIRFFRFFLFDTYIKRVLSVGGLFVTVELTKTTFRMTSDAFLALLLFMVVDYFLRIDEIGSLVRGLKYRLKLSGG